MELREIIKHCIMFAGSIFRRNRKSKILYYHDVYSTVNYKALDADICMGTHINLFKQHIDVIKSEGYEIVQKITKPYGQIAIMFDDGFRGIWECRQYFYDNKIFPTVFLPVQFIGETIKGILTKEEILELQDNGFNFECHTWSHRKLTDFNDNELMRELGDSKDHLSEMLSKNVKGLCMPLGFFSDHLIEKIHEFGYEDIYCCIPGNYSDKPFGMITRNLCQYSTTKELRLILRGGNEFLKSHYKKLQKLS